MVGVLVALSLLMITLHFRETPTGGMHAIQDAGATVLRPFQVAAERIARPFRDTVGYFDGLIDAKGENERLRAENERLLLQATQYRAAYEENKVLKEYANYRAPRAYPEDFDHIAAAVISRPASQFEQQVIVQAGSDAGVGLNDPVVSPAGVLVGLVTDVTRDTAQVTLLLDASIAVSAEVLGRGATGVVKNGAAGSDTLVLDLVKKKLRVEAGDRVVTAGTRVGADPSLYPRAIPIGTVTFVGQRDTDVFKSIQIEPLVDFDKLRSVLVLAAKDVNR